MSQNSSRKKTQYERGHEAAHAILDKYRAMLACLTTVATTTHAMELVHSLLYVAWRRGYDAARRDARKGGGR